MPGRPTTWLFVGLGLAALLWGVASLQRIFDAEREEARAALRAQETALADYARRDLARRLETTWASERHRLIAAARDPLLPADGLYLRRRDRTVLPRTASPREGDAMPARDLYARLIDVHAPLPDVDADGVWADRLYLLRALQQATAQAGDVEDVFRRLLTHQARYRIAAERDLPFQVALLDFFMAEGTPDSGLMRRLLRDGLTASDGAQLPGLQRHFLDRLDRFTDPDLRFLAGRVVALSEDAGVPHDDFMARLREAGLAGPPPAADGSVSGASAPDLPDVPADPVLASNGPALVAGRWLLVARADGVEGVAVVPETLLEAVAEAMRAEALLYPEDALALVAPADLALAPADLEVSVLAPRFGRAEKEIRRRHRLKSALGGLLALSTLGIVGLVGLLAARERRHLALRAEFVAAVSHELRTPLASVRLLAETLERRLDGSDAARDYPTRIVREADRLSLLVENILSFNRLEGAAPTARPTPVDLVEIAGAAGADLELHARGRVVLDLEGAHPTELHADPELLSLTLLNLFGNACRHNARDPVRITVRADGREDGVDVRVRDNGMGIPPEDWERVFTEFYRRATGGEGARGFGLGLAICRRIMALHGGSIRVETSGPEGTTFLLFFPAEAG